MGTFVLENRGMPVSGAVEISGAKNSALPLLAASVLCGRTVLNNCPHLSDTFAAIDILKKLGFKAELENNRAVVETAYTHISGIPRELCGKMRSSVLFLAPVTARCGCGRVCAPGGCRLGERPVNMHLYALEKLGAKITLANGEILAEAENGFSGADIFLAFPSVGATETAVMAAAAAYGKTRIFNPALEPEIEDLCIFLNSAGADIKFGSVIEINGNCGLLGNAEHRVIPDRIEAGTYLAAAAITGGELFLRKTRPEHLGPVCEMLRGMGCVINCGSDDIYIDAPAGLWNPPFLETGPYPQFPTDMQPQMTALFAANRGECVIREAIFEGRQGHIGELRKMGAEIIIADKHTFMVKGGGHALSCADTAATDLRCGAALLLAALTARRGKSTVKNGEYILRGYENICEKMGLIGVDLKYLP